MEESIQHGDRLRQYENPIRRLNKNSVNKDQWDTSTSSDVCHNAQVCSPVPSSYVALSEGGGWGEIHTHSLCVHTHGHDGEDSRSMLCCKQVPTVFHYRTPAFPKLMLAKRQQRHTATDEKTYLLPCLQAMQVVTPVRDRWLPSD